MNLKTCFKNEQKSDNLKKNGKLVAIIQARVGSSRLPGKVLKEILGKPMIQLMLERIRMARLVNELVIATSVNSKDNALAELAKKLGIKCFRGSEDDVMSRVLGAADFVGADHIVELWGDTPLLDPVIVDHAIEFYLQNDFDCVGTCLDKTFPWGMSLLIFSTQILTDVSQKTNDPVDREHVSNYIYEHPEIYKIGHVPCPADIRRPEIRLTVDEAADFELVSKIFEHFEEQHPYFTTRDILNFLDSHPQLKKVNTHVRQRKLRA